MNAVERFFSKVQITNTCWLWVGATNNGGYGRFRFGKLEQVHRVSYAWYYGDLPEGLPIDHICRVRLCVNPRHLEAVTTWENVRRQNLLPKKQKLFCVNNHQFSSENTYIRPNGDRDCRACNKLRVRKCRMSAQKVEVGS